MVLKLNFIYLFFSLVFAMSLFNTTPPVRFEPMYIGSCGPYIDFHFAIIEEFNKPKRKKVMTWFVLNYKGELCYQFHGRRITSVMKDDGMSYAERQKFLSCSGMKFRT